MRPKKKLKNTKTRRLVKQACSEVLQKNPKYMPRVVFDEESKTGFGFEIRPQQQKI